MVWHVDGGEGRRRKQGEEEEGEERRTSWGCTLTQDTAASTVSACMEAQAKPGLNMEQFNASAAEKSTGEQRANKEAGSR